MDRITIVGMGLIGTSLGLALKKADLGLEIVGTDRDRAVSGTAKRMGACDSTQNNPLDAIRGARMVILATPVGGIREMLKLYGPELEPGVIVTDTGSTKAEVLAWAEEFLPDTVSFVGGHPMAGKELSGPVAAEADLFQNATYCIIPGKGADEDCSVNFKYGAKRDFNAWLATLGPDAPVRTLAELREWNLAHERAGAMKYGQARFDISDEMDVEVDRARNEADMARDELLSRTRGIDAVLAEYDLDAILTPGSRGAGLAARSGTPIVVVPFGFVPNEPTQPFPQGFDARPAPFGVGFTGANCSEPRLIELAYAFEQATQRRVPPPGVP